LNKKFLFIYNNRIIYTVIYNILVCGLNIA
jgi:hypothetical protein